MNAIIAAFVGFENAAPIFSFLRRLKLYGEQFGVNVEYAYDGTEFNYVYVTLKRKSPSGGSAYGIPKKLKYFREDNAVYSRVPRILPCFIVNIIFSRTFNNALEYYN